MRRVVVFSCGNDDLVGTVDAATGDTGVLIVSGGNEARCGAHRGMALLARRLADAGVPVFRFDRRGVGDSAGENHGYGESGPDIAAALAAFRREQPNVRHVVGFGNCDAATALLLLDRGCEALVLANPWLGDEDASPPPAALRAHYLARLRSARAWRRVMTGNLVLRLRNLAAAFARTPEQPLSEQVSAALALRPATIVLARGDRTGQVFAGSVRVPDRMRVIQLDTRSHSFAGRGEELAQVILDAVTTLPLEYPHRITPRIVDGIAEGA